MSKIDHSQEVVASGEALQVVAGWLGISDASEALNEEDNGAGAPPARPLGLGLGAKYLPHHKGVALTAGVQQRLGNKLKHSKNSAWQSSGTAHEAFSRKRPPQALQAGQGGTDQADSSNGSSDEDARGAAFFKGGAQMGMSPVSKVQQQQQPMQRFTKQDLLGPSKQLHHKKKRRKRGGPL